MHYSTIDVIIKVHIMADPSTQKWTRKMETHFRLLSLLRWVFLLSTLDVMTPIIHRWPDDIIKHNPKIIYCEDIEAWVFQHQNIRTSPTQDEEVRFESIEICIHLSIYHLIKIYYMLFAFQSKNDCSWLLKSQNTDSYDIIELAEETEVSRELSFLFLSSYI